MRIPFTRRSNMHKRIMTTVAVLAVASAAPALAQSDYRAPWRGDFWGYIGASAGQSKFKTDCHDSLTEFFDCDKRDTGFKVYAGGKMNDWLGLEVGYTDFGKVAASGGQTEAWAVPISLVAGAPLGERFGVFGKVGGLYGHTDVTANAETLVETGHKTGWGWTYGAGATFAITPAVQLRADYDRYKLDFVGGRRDIDMLTAGVQMRF
jgi:opacity protein-like surface antigen